MMIRTLKIFRFLFILCALAMIPKYVIKDVSEERASRQRIAEIRGTEGPTKARMVGFTILSTVLFTTPFLLLAGVCHLLIFALRKDRIIRRLSDDSQYATDPPQEPEPPESPRQLAISEYLFRIGARGSLIESIHQ